jgi:DNA-binding transcriptional regulator YdaS (Cro superfamily)
METINPVDAAIKAAGSASELARRLNISFQAIQQWKKIPAERVVAVEAATGIPRQQLRPDLYGAAEAA